MGDEMVLDKGMKVSVIGGAGVVGSTAAYGIAQDGLASEIVLVDTNWSLAEAHALDIDQAVAHRSMTRVYVGETKDTKNSDIIIFTVSSPRPLSLSSRSEFLPQNLQLVISLLEPLLAHSPTAIWILTTVPVDPLIYLMHRTFSIPRHKVLGLNWNDTSRFRWAIAKTLSVPCSDVEAYVLGEHGESQVPLFSLVKIRGKKIFFNSEQRNKIRSEVADFLPRWIKLKPGRTAGWITAESVGGIFRSIFSNDRQIWVCSTPLEGEYGLSEVSLGVPMILSSEGVQNIIEFDLDSVENGALKASASIIKNQIKEGKELLNRLRKDSR